MTKTTMMPAAYAGKLGHEKTWPKTKWPAVVCRRLTSHGACQSFRHSELVIHKRDSYVRRIKSSHSDNSATSVLKRPAPESKLARGEELGICELMLDWKDCLEVERSPDKVSGAWVFRGTRVPVRALFDNLEAGAKVDDFLAWFEGVTRAQVDAVLEHASASLSTAK